MTSLNPLPALASPHLSNPHQNPVAHAFIDANTIGSRRQEGHNGPSGSRGPKLSATRSMSSAGNARRQTGWRQCGPSGLASVNGGTEAWRARFGELIRESARAPHASIVHTEWTHAGGDRYSI
jgi:hypothetical protein